MSYIACGSIHQGHEWFISAMNLEEGKRFLCVWLLSYVSNFCRFANEARCQDIFMEIIFCSVHSAVVFFSVLGKNTSIRSKLPTAVCSLREKREEGVKSTCCMSKASQIIRSIRYSSPVEALNLIVESKSLPAEVNDLNIELHLHVEVKEKLAIILLCGFNFLATVLSVSYHNTTMMRFVMTFDDTLRDGSSFGKLANSMC